MKGSFKALVIRSLAGLAFSRLFLAGGVLLLLVLFPLATTSFFLKNSMEASPEETGGMIRDVAWGSGSIGFTLIIQVFAISLATSGLSADLKRGTLFGVLARPVSRDQVYYGTWVACALLVLGFEAFRLVPSIVGLVAIEGRLDPRVLFGCGAVIAGESLTLSLFLFLAVLFEPVFAMVIGTCWFALILYALKDHSSPGPFLAYLVASPFPQPLLQMEKLSHALTGKTKEWGPVLEFFLYRMAWTALFLVAGAWCFRRKDLAPRI